MAEWRLSKFPIVAVRNRGGDRGVGAGFAAVVTVEVPRGVSDADDGAPPRIISFAVMVNAGSGAEGGGLDTASAHEREVMVVIRRIAELKKMKGL